MFKRPRSESDFANEIESHLAIETDRLIAEGMSVDDARHAARKLFGNVTTQTEHFHESRPTAFVDASWRNVRYALRGLVKRPAFAITATLTLAFGIGVNAALFTLLYSLLLRPPPVGDPSRFVNVSREVHDDGRNYSLYVKGRASMVSWPDYLRLRQGTQNLEQIAVYRGQSLSLDVGDRSVAINGELASCNYFVTARVPMARGRAFLPEECASNGAGSVVVLSYAHWQRRFGGDTTIIGRSLTINRQPFTVIGVAAQGFAGVTFAPAEVWVPVTMYASLLPGTAKEFDRDISWLAAFGRLRADANPDGAAAELTTLARAEDSNWPGRVSTIHVGTGSLAIDPDDRAGVVAAVTGATVLGALILLMCCANVMNLLLARANARRREIGIRLSLGASRARLIVQLMVESGVLAFAGGTLGMVLAWWLPPLIKASAPDQELNLVLTPDVWVLAATVVVAVGAALLFGLIPALQSTNLQLTAALRNDSGAGTRRGSASNWRNAAVVAQVSVSALLLVTAAMFLRATQRSFTIKPGFDIAGVSTLSFDLEQANYDSVRTRAFFSAMREGFLTTSGVKSVAATQMIPLRGRATTEVNVDGAQGKLGPALRTMVNNVSSDYFRTLGIPVVSGRVFSDNEFGDPASIVVSEAFAKRAWPNTNPIGRTVTEDSHQLVVVGVVRDIQSASLGTNDGPYYYKLPSQNNESVHLVVRTELSASQVQSLATRIAHQFDANLIVTVRGLDEELQRVVAPVQLAGKMASALGLVAMLLAAVGVYGVVAFAVSQRSREIGIRMALGATRRSVQTMMFRQGARVVGVGLALGIALSIGSSQAIRSMLFGLSALDGVAFVTVALLLSIVASVAVAIPAARASRVDPVASLRED
ncbi:MAG: ABC transporter permease [Gemmatimonadaceae bacterium]